MPADTGTSLYTPAMGMRELVQGATIRVMPKMHDASGITVAWCSPGITDNRFTESLSAMHVFDKFYGGNRIWSTISIEGGPRIVETRTQIIENFINKLDLSHPVSCEAPTWLATVDADMGFEGDAIHRLVTIAEEGDPNTGDPIHIIGGLCFAGGRTHMTPTIYREYVDEDGKALCEPLREYPKNALLKVAATGAAFMVVHRDVLIKMYEAFKTAPDGYPHPHPWYVEGQYKGKQFGEDIAFCRRAAAIGYPTWVHTGVKTDHMKRFALNEDLYDDIR